MYYMPFSLLKSSDGVMALLIARLANLSFTSGVFPSSLKHGRVTPLLKKPGLDKSDIASYQPITNLRTQSKLLEKLALQRLRPHIAAMRLATCDLCSRRHKLPHVCFLVVSADVLKVRLNTKAPKKFSYIYI